MQEDSKLLAAMTILQTRKAVSYRLGYVASQKLHVPAQVYGHSMEKCTNTGSVHKLRFAGQNTANLAPLRSSFSTGNISMLVTFVFVASKPDLPWQTHMVSLMPWQNTRLSLHDSPSLGLALVAVCLHETILYPSCTSFAALSHHISRHRMKMQSLLLFCCQV